jgi:hypothetical protein
MGSLVFYGKPDAFAKDKRLQTEKSWWHHSGFRNDDQSCSYLSKLRLYIGGLARIALLIGTGVSAFTTGDMGVPPSILVLLCVGTTGTGGNSTLS